MNDHLSYLRIQIRQGETHLRQRDKTLGKVMDRVGSCRWAEYVMEPFDALVWSILGQQISTHAAASITARLAVSAGRPFRARSLAGIPEGDYRAAGLSRNKTKAVRHLADAVADGRVNLESLQDAPDDQVIRTLSGLPGIGPWTAEMFLIFGLGRPDVFSAGDLGLRKAVALAYRLDTVPTPAECAARAVAWSPYRTIAAWYLWRLVDP